MHVHSTNNVLVSLNVSEIETIISALEIDWREWQTERAGALLMQFQHLHDDLTKQIANISDNSV